MPKSLGTVVLLSVACAFTHSGIKTICFWLYDHITSCTLDTIWSQTSFWKEKPVKTKSVWLDVLEITTEIQTTDLCAGQWGGHYWKEVEVPQDYTDPALCSTPQWNGTWTWHIAIINWQSGLFFLMIKSSWWNYEKHRHSFNKSLLCICYVPGTVPKTQQWTMWTLGLQGTSCRSVCPVMHRGENVHC